MSGLGTVFGFLFSIPGLITIMIGLLLFVCLPFISLISSFKGFSKLSMSLATLPLRRAAIVVSEHNDALFRQMKFVNLGYETMVIDGETKVFEDPDSALHYWNGIKFALADEEDGVLFDPRHAALGMRKKMKDDYDEDEYLATTEEWEEFGVAKWKPGVFEMPNVHELVDLSAVQALVDGGERSEYAERVKELYKNSRDPFDSGTPAIKYLYPIIALIAPFATIWVLKDQFGGGAGASSVSFGALWLLFVSLSNPVAGLNWKRAAGASLLVGIPTLIIGLLFIFTGPTLTVAIVIALLIGLAVIPLLTIIAQMSSVLAGALSKLHFKLGFLGYRKPVFEWTPEKYVLREYDSLATTDNIEWYNLFGATVGFTYRPGTESWGAEPISDQEIRSQQPVTDGGNVTDTNLPQKYTRSEQMKRDSYGGYLPTRLDNDSYYLRTGIALNRFSNSATGERSLRKLLEAKDLHGTGNDGLDDGTVFWTSVVCGLLSTALGVGLLILPMFL